MSIMILTLFMRGKNGRIINLETDINPKVGNFLFGAEKQFYKVNYKKYIPNIITSAQMGTLNKIEEIINEIGLTNFPEKTRPHIKNTISLAKAYFTEKEENEEEENLQIKTITLSQILDRFLQALLSFSILKKSPDQIKANTVTESTTESQQEDSQDNRKKRSITTDGLLTESSTLVNSFSTNQGYNIHKDLENCVKILRDQNNIYSNKKTESDLKREEKNEIKELLCSCRIHIINFQSYFSTKAAIGRIVGKSLGRKVRKGKATTILDLYLRRTFGKLVLEKVGSTIVVCDDVQKGNRMEDEMLESIEDTDDVEDNIELNRANLQESSQIDLKEEEEEEEEDQTTIINLPKPEFRDDLGQIIEESDRMFPYDPDTPYNHLIKYHVPDFYFSPGKQNKDGQIMNVDQEILNEIYQENPRIGQGCREEYLNTFEYSPNLESELKNSEINNQIQFELNYQEQYLKCINIKPRTTRSPQDIEQKVEISTAQPSTSNNLNDDEQMDVLFTQSIAQLNTKDQQMIKLLYIYGANKVMEFSYRLNNYILTHKLEMEMARTTGIFNNIEAFSLATGLNGLIQVIWREENIIGLIELDKIYYKATQTLFCRLDNCYKLLDIYVENLYILEIKNGYRFCAQIEKIKNKYICKKQDILPKCSFGTFKDEHCAFSRIPLVINDHYFEHGGTKIIIDPESENNIIIRNIGSTNYNKGGLELKPLMKVKGEKIEKLFFHMDAEEIAYGTHLINIESLHIFNLYQLEKGIVWILGSISITTLSAIFWIVLITKWIIKKIQLRIIDKHKELQRGVLEAKIRIYQMEQLRSNNKKFMDY